jgi:hypothetical protein
MQRREKEGKILKEEVWMKRGDVSDDRSRKKPNSKSERRKANARVSGTRR